MALKLVTNSLVTVASAGTPVQVSTSVKMVNSVSIQASSGNTGIIYVGDSGVTAANGHELAGGEVLVINAFDKPFNLEEMDLSKLYIDAATSADTARIISVQVDKPSN